MKNIYLIITLFIILSCANNDITVPDKNIKNI
ncbi:unclassified [Brachyspira pilosicoli WesB]|uniref:Unclassified n=1 Tax=Brachyspira pilosicoli WesB TaxID=1161918 RepID=K0JIE7_BRAPL|nr:unclassified [Brachyspira pilosicoli WesB]